MADKEYWSNYYKNHFKKEQPSNFAKWILDTYQPKGKLIELGCGNGRDSLFFAENGLEVTAVDQSAYAITHLNNFNLDNATFVESDFTWLSLSGFDYIYSRFTLHSIDKTNASRVYQWAKKALNLHGEMYIEVRSVNDNLYGVGDEVGKDEWFTDHYRRFLRIEELREELISVGLSIVYAEESKGFAPYKDNDPPIIRIVAKNI